jgi:hypothetical protein
MKDEKATKIYTATFNHVYLTNGFAISSELTHDKKPFIPTKTHACLRFGYWCWKNFWEHPQGLFAYLKLKLRSIT